MATLVSERDVDVATETIRVETLPQESNLVVNASTVTAGTLRGSNVVAGSFATKGSTLAAGNVAGVSTLTLVSTADFESAGGSAVIFSATAARDYDAITYTGKTATTLTGVTGVLAHSTGEVIIPTYAAVGSGPKVLVIDSNVGEMRFYSGPLSGAVSDSVLMASIGLGTDNTVMKLGQGGVNVLALDCQGGISGGYVAQFTNNGGGASTAHGILATAPSVGVRGIGGSTGYGLGAAHYGVYGVGGVGTLGESTASDGVGVLGKTTGTDGRAGYFYHTGNGGSGANARYSGDATGASFELSIGTEGIVGSGALTGRGAHLRFSGYRPSSPPVSGTYDLCDTYMSNAGVWVTYDGSSWRSFLRDNDTLTAANGTAANPGLTFSTTQNQGLFRKTSTALGFAAGGLEVGSVTSAGLWTFQGDVSVTGNSTLTGAVITSAIGPTSARQHALPNVASDTIALLGQAQTWGGVNTFTPRVLLTAGYNAADVNYDFQGGITSVAATGTMTGAQILTRYIRNTGAAITLTTDTGTNLDTALGLTQTNRCIDFTVANHIGTGIVTIAMGTGVTSTGTMTIPIGGSGMFRLRRTAAATYVVLRLI